MRSPLPSCGAALALLLLALAWFPRGAVGADEETFSAVREALDAGAYHAALQRLQDAESAGASGPRLHFYRGVANFRLERYQDALAAFTRVSEFPQWAVIGHFNAAKAAARMGYFALAGRHYRRVLDLAPDDRVREEALAQLEALSAPATPARTTGKLRMTAVAALGFDDNPVLSGLNAEVLEIPTKSDWFVDGSVDLTYDLDSQQQAGWSLAAGISAREYRELDLVDQAQGFLAAERVWRPSPSLELYLKPEVVSLVIDGSEAERLGGLEVGSLHQVAEDHYLRLAGAANYIKGLDDLDFLTGWQYRGELLYVRQWPASGLQWGIGYRYEHNAREDERLAYVAEPLSCGPIGLICVQEQADVREFYSYSPSIHHALMKLYWSPSLYWLFEAEASYEVADYEAYEATARSPDTGEQIAAVTQQREDRRAAADLSAERRLSVWWSVSLGYRFERSVSNIDFFDYRRNTVSLSLQRRFW